MSSGITQCNESDCDFGCCIDNTCGRNVFECNFTVALFAVSLVAVVILIVIVLVCCKISMRLESKNQRVHTQDSLMNTQPEGTETKAKLNGESTLYIQEKSDVDSPVGHGLSLLRKEEYLKKEAEVPKTEGFHEIEKESIFHRRIARGKIMQPSNPNDIMTKMTLTVPDYESIEERRNIAAPVVVKKVFVASINSATNDMGSSGGMASFRPNPVSIQQDCEIALPEEVLEQPEGGDNVYEGNLARTELPYRVPEVGIPAPEYQNNANETENVQREEVKQQPNPLYPKHPLGTSKSLPGDYDQEELDIHRRQLSQRVEKGIMRPDEVPESYVVPQELAAEDYETARDIQLAGQPAPFMEEEEPIQEEEAPYIPQQEQVNYEIEAQNPIPQEIIYEGGQAGEPQEIVSAEVQPIYEVPGSQAVYNEEALIENSEVPQEVVQYEAPVAVPQSAPQVKVRSNSFDYQVLLTIRRGPHQKKLGRNKSFNFI